VGRVLVVDDEQSLRDVLEVLVSSLGHVVTVAADVSSAARALEKQDVDLVITDLRLEPGGSGLDVVRSARARRDPPEVIMMTAFGTREVALEAQQLGALFYVEKGPHLASDLRVLVGHAIDKRRLRFENEELRRRLRDRFELEGIVGRSEAMREVLELVRRVAPSRANVLLVGESGTGKERVARAIHMQSERRDGPFIPINCGAIPENLIESELFGHVRGAFTGADREHTGLFVAAKGGTVFLDEIGELPLALQPKLLRVLQERRAKPVGATQELDVDARVVAATNRDLESEVRAGRFREDLFFRLNVLQIDLPPLRARRDDIPILVQTFLEKFAREYKSEVVQLSPAALAKLLTFRFPGNVRQLENVIERCVALSRGGEVGVDALPREIRDLDEERQTPAPAVVSSTGSPAAFPSAGVDLERAVEALEVRLITQALETAGGVKTRAAELLGLSFRQFRYKFAKYADRLERIAKDES
jgi:two-component system response regulator PilR (NtrC family)